MNVDRWEAVRRSVLEHGNKNLTPVALAEMIADAIEMGSRFREASLRCEEFIDGPVAVGRMYCVRGPHGDQYNHLAEDGYEW